MSLYVEWINSIKEKAEERWLTHSQRQTYELILSKWRSHSFVNLHGPSGSGKTFVAHMLAKNHGYFYTHSLDEVPIGAEEVLLDSADYTRMLRAVARDLKLGRIVLITRLPILEAMPQLKLELDERDVRQFQAALSQHCGITFIETVPEGRDLADIIRREVVARGESYVC